MSQLKCALVCVCALGFLPQITQQLGWAIDDSGCITPDSKVGDCVDVLECEPIVEIVYRNALRPARQRVDISPYVCSIARGTKVCCPRVYKSSSTVPATTTEKSRTPRVKKNLNETVMTTVMDTMKNLTAKGPEVNVNMTIDGRNQLPQEGCGLFEGENRVSHGQLANLFEFPWMALLAYKTRSGGITYGCGGTLINNRYVLTAAHCVLENKEMLLSYVRLGELDMNNATDCDLNGVDPVCHGATEDIRHENIIVHPGFNFTAYQNDIALIRLERSVEFKDHISPICLPLTTELQNVVLKNLVVAGWGETEKGIASDSLLKAEVSIVDSAQCDGNYPYITINRGHFCAGGGPTKKRGCPGDSGGPAQALQVMDTNVKYVQFGVYSFAGGPCGSKLPGVYTNVANYVDWIINNVQP